MAVYNEAASDNMVFSKMHGLLKPFTVFFCLGLLLLLSFSQTRYQSSSERLSTVLLQQIAEAENVLSLLGSTTADEQLFYDFRKRFKSLEWTYPLFFDPETVEHLTSSKFWVFQEQSTGYSFEETGSLQAAEAYGNYGRLKSELSKFFSELKEKISTTKFSFPEVVLALLNDIYQQYFLHLTGYDLINTDQLINEYQLLLQNYVQILQTLNQDATGHQKKQIKTTIHLLNHASKFTKKYSFENLDRASLFKKYLVPIQDNLSHLASDFQTPTPDWAKHLNWSVSPFSVDWLEPEAFIQDTIAYPKDSLVALGALLFVEPMLSSNNKRACISCHKPSKAFSDGRQTSLGFDFSAKLARNAPSLVNTVYNQRFGHDLTFTTLEEQILSVVNHHQEFRSSMQEIVAKLATSKQYSAKFQNCFKGSSSIDSTQVLRALSSYMESLIFLDSPFDQYMRGASDRIEPAVLNGYNLFMGKAACGSCHFAPLFSGLKPLAYQTQEYQSGYYHRVENGSPKKHRDLGVASSSLKKGKGDVEQYEFYFKIPTVRNLDFTIPYLHDGSWMSLDSLWKQYQYIIPVDEERSVSIKKITTDKRSLSTTEIKQIRSFLNSLNEKPSFPDPELLELPLTDGTKAPIRRRAGGIY